MKLSNTKSLTITSASAVVFGFGVFVTQVSALETDIVSPEVSSEIQQSLGEGDSNELLVDALTQVEFQLKELNISKFATDSADPINVKELKAMRRQYIQELRLRMQQLDGPERGEFLQRIRDRRQNVRSLLFEVRKENLAQRQAQKQQKIEESEAELQKSREAFKLKFQQEQEQRELKAEYDKKTPQEKFQEKVLKKQERLDQKYSQSQVKIMLQEKEEKENREQVKGAIDYKPQSLFEKIGYLVGLW